MRPMVAQCRGSGAFITKSLLGLALTVWAGQAAAFVVSGQITDSAGSAIPLVQVEIYDSDIGPDDLLDTTYANAAGNYSINLTNFFFENPDVYISVEWWFQMLPAASFNDHLIKLTDAFNATSNTSAAFTSKEGPITPDHDPNLALPGKNLQMDQAQPARLAGLVGGINLSLQYYQNNKGSVSWEVNWDVPVTVQTGSIVSFFSGGAITISQVDIPPATGSGFASDIYHEMGHLVHWRIGNDLPPGGCGGPHSSTAETNTSCAIVEGWASYVGELTDNGPGGANDGKYSNFRDTGFNRWLGNETPPTAYVGTSFESGDIIEGAYGGVWFGIDMVAGVSTFEDNFNVMVEDDPDDMFEFIDGITDDFGANTAKTRGVYGALQAHGIVYSRGRFESDPFDEPEPPDAAPGAEESYAKEIDGIMFLRGKELTVKLEEVPKASLAVGNSQSNDKFKIGYKAANDATADAGSTITVFTGEENVGPIDLDTQAIGDGDWDLVVIGKNTDGFTDNLTPDWSGDGNAKVNTDERYLKTLGTWYDKDRDPATNAIKEGKVIIDNTAPTVDAAMFKPVP